MSISRRRKILLSLCMEEGRNNKRQKMTLREKRWNKSQNSRIQVQDQHKTSIISVFDIILSNAFCCDSRRINYWPFNTTDVHAFFALSSSIALPLRIEAHLVHHLTIIKHLSCYLLAYRMLRSMTEHCIDNEQRYRERSKSWFVISSPRSGKSILAHLDSQRGWRRVYLRSAPSNHNCLAAIALLEKDRCQG